MARFQPTKDFEVKYGYGPDSIDIQDEKFNFFSLLQVFSYLSPRRSYIKHPRTSFISFFNVFMTKPQRLSGCCWRNMTWSESHLFSLESCKYLISNVIYECLGILNLKIYLQNTATLLSNRHVLRRFRSLKRVTVSRWRTKAWTTNIWGLESMPS